MKINVCIPTLNSYDTLLKCIESIAKSTIKVDGIFIIDNGGGIGEGFRYSGDAPVTIYKVPHNLGVAASWNRFINNIEEIRIICNDDIEFYPDAIEQMVNSYDNNNLIFPTGIENPNAFSCFILPQSIINRVGLFDEKISPNYAYFEDNDYHRRMLLAGFGIKTCQADIKHIGSSTIGHYTDKEMNEHHRKFKLAQSLYKRKWGGLPGSETREIPVE